MTFSGSANVTEEVGRVGIVEYGQQLRGGEGETGVENHPAQHSLFAGGADTHSAIGECARKRGKVGQHRSSGDI